MRKAVKPGTLKVAEPVRARLQGLRDVAKAARARLQYMARHGKRATRKAAKLPVFQGVSQDGASSAHPLGRVVAVVLHFCTFLN